MTREAEIQRVLGRCVEQFLRDASLEISQVIDAHPDLQPELAELLEQLNFRLSGKTVTLPFVPLQPRPPAGKSCLTGERISRYLSGRLGPIELWEITSHLATCSECAEEVESQRAFRDLEPAAAGPPKRPSLPTLASYDFVRKLGGGGQGEVWLVEHRPTRQRRAAKFVRTANLSPVRRQQIGDEMRVMSALGKHHHRVLLYDFFEDADFVTIVMEFIPGRSLGSRLASSSPLPWREALHVVRGVGEGLVEVHQRGILHRDIKPDNILIHETGIAVLGDFGLASTIDGCFGIVGTAGYIAPEILDNRVSEKLDVFSLAATLFCMLTGSPPFDSTNALAGIGQARAGLPTPEAVLAELPEAVRELVLSGLRPNPATRLSLEAFIAQARRAELAGLSATLDQLSRAGAVELNVDLHKCVPGESALQPVPWEDPATLPAGVVSAGTNAFVANVRAGELLEMRVSSNETGYLHLLSLTSAGELATLFPDDLESHVSTPAGQILRLGCLVEPPNGLDQVAILWTRDRVVRTASEWWDWLAHDAEAAPCHVRNISLVSSGIQPEGGIAVRIVSLIHLDSSIDAAASRPMALTRGGESLRRIAESPPTAPPHHADDNTEALEAARVTTVVSPERRPTETVRLILECPTGVVPGEPLTFRVRPCDPHEHGSFEALLSANSFAMHLSGDGLDQSAGWPRWFPLHNRREATIRVPVSATYQGRLVEWRVTLVRIEPGIPRVPVASWRGAISVTHGKTRVVTGSAGAAEHDSESRATFPATRVTRPTDNTITLQPPLAYRYAHLIGASEDASVMRACLPALTAAGLKFHPELIGLREEARWLQGTFASLETAQVCFVFWSPALLELPLLLEELRFARRRQRNRSGDRLEVFPVRCRPEWPVPQVVEWDACWGQSWPGFLES